MGLPEFRLENYFARWEFAARHHLSASDAETMALCDLLELAGVTERAGWEGLRLGYAPTQGSRALREAIASTYERVSAEQVLCFAGAQEGLYCAMHALLQSGDHAIVIAPNYQSMESVPGSICEVSGLALDPACGWQMDLEALRSLLRPATRLVAVNFPNNPTGAIADERTFRELVELCRERGIALFSDEVYRGVERDPSRRLPQAADLYERALSLHVLSKAYGLPGLRVGWIACRDGAVLDRMQQIKHYLSICNATPSETLALIALRAGEAILQRNRELCARNLAKLRVFFDRHAQRFEWEEPPGGCVGYPRYLGADGVETFCKDVIERAGVLLVPASNFRSALVATPVDRFRIGYGRRGIDEALAAVDELLA